MVPVEVIWVLAVFMFIGYIYFDYKIKRLEKFANFVLNSLVEAGIYRVQNNSDEINVNKVNTENKNK